MQDNSENKSKPKLILTSNKHSMASSLAYGGSAYEFMPNWIKFNSYPDALPLVSYSIRKQKDVSILNYTRISVNSYYTYILCQKSSYTRNPCSAVATVQVMLI